MEVFRDITREEEERQIVEELEKEEEMETISQSNKRGRESTFPQHVQEVSQQQRKSSKKSKEIEKQRHIVQMCNMKK